MRRIGALSVVWLLVAGCALTHSSVQIDWVDLVQLGGITYVAAWTSPNRTLLPSDLGPVFGQVKVKLEGTNDPNHRLQEGDAAFLAPGTSVYRVNGYRPTFRLAATHDGRLTLYEADTNPKANVGAELLDLAGRVVYIGINSESDGHTELAAIKDPSAVGPLVDLVEQSRVDQTLQGASGTRYFIDFHMVDGTEVIRAYWPDDCLLARGIEVPVQFRVAVSAALGCSLACPRSDRGSACSRVSRVPQAPPL